MEKELENERLLLRISKEVPLVQYIFKEGAHVDIKNVDVDYNFYISFINKELGEEGQFYSLVEISKKTKIDNDAMKRLSELYKPLEARKLRQAFVCPTSVAKILVYIYLKLGSNGSSLEKKSFTDKEKAIAWLKS